MDGKIFLYSNGTLPRIAFSPDAFTFDLQRFAEVSVTGNETNGYTVNNKTIKKDTAADSNKYVIEGEDTKYDSLEAAVVAANSDIKFSVTTKSGTPGTETTKYYNAAEDFKNDYLKDATGITIYGDVILQDNTTINLGTDVKNVIKVAKNATLNLGASTLTINRTGENSATATGNYDTPASAIVVQNGATFNVEGDTTGTINYAWTPTDGNLKASRTSAAVQVGERVGAYDTIEVPVNTATATFNMKSGNIKSVSTAISMADNGIVSISGGMTESTKSCGIYYGNKSPGGGQITISNGTLQSGANSIYPAIQVSGDVGSPTSKKNDSKETPTFGTNAKPAEINITGGTIAFTNNDYNDKTKSSSLFGTDNKPVGNPDAIYAGGVTTLKISGGTIKSTGTGVELRAGSLDFTGGEISSSATEYKAKTSNKSNTSGGQTFGAAIAVTQHATDQSITVNVSGENTKASGAVALVVENTSARTDTTSKIEATLTDGATFESTNAAAIAAKAADKRSTINISNVTFVGNLEDAVAEASSGGAETSAPSFHITGTVTIAKKEDGKLVTVAEYDAESVTLKYNTGTPTNPIYVTVQEGWWRLVANQWLYLVKDPEKENIANAVATLQPAIDGTETSTTTLELTYAASSLSADSVLALDMTTDMFKSAAYTILNASETTPTSDQKKFNFNITGNDSTASIIGGVGDDTIKAIHSVGAFLNGGVGDDLLIGGDGKDTFAFSGGSDTIQGYVYGTDAVSLGSNDYKLPETFAGINNSDSSNFVLAVGTGASLTFRPTTALTIAQPKATGSGQDIFSYTASTIAKNDNISLGAGYTSKEYDGRNLAYQVIDASQVTTTSGINLRANDKNSTLIGASTGGALYGGEGNDILKAGNGNTTLNGGAGSDSLVGGNGADVFIYDGNAGGTDTVSGYGDNDLVNVRNVRLSDAEFKSETTTTGEAADTKSTTNISLSWGGDDNLIFQDVSDKVVSVKSGSSTYLYTKNYYAHNKGITLAAGYDVTESDHKLFNGESDNFKDYATINAAAVNNAISVMGNSLGNYIFGSTGKNATLNGGAGNDKLNVNERGTEAKYLFEFTEGKDEVIGFDATKDTVSVAVDRITAAKLSNGNSKLTLTVNKNKDVLTLRSEDEIEKVSLQSGGYLTKDGYVSGQGFSLFGSAKGQIDLNDALYKGSNISLVAADSVKSQGVTLVGSENLTDVAFAANNKKRDGFVYGGGNVTISGYEAGRDRIDLGSATLTSFDVVQNGENKDVALRTSNGVISILGAGRQEVLLHDTSKGNGYKKMVFAQTGVIENKQKNPTMATVSGSPYESKYIAGNTIKKIYVTGLDEAGVSIQAGGKNNTQIDASNAGKGVSLSGGAKNDKLIGSDESDLFVYSAGKDVIQGYSGGDSIKIGDFESSLSSAKITAGSKSIKFQFNNKNTLTIKANKDATLDGALTIGDTNYTYTKNAIESGGQATLTNAFSGTFDTANHKVTTVNGSAVSKNLTYKGSEAAESLVGGTKKTTFKGAGGQDSLVGGTGKDVFFYAKGDAGTTTIANFDFGSNGRAGNDKLKIASGTIGEISTIEGGGVQFAMNSGKKGDTSNIGWFQIKSGYNTSTKEVIQNIDASKVAIKANNTYYWFAPQDIQADDGSNDVLAKAGQLITSDSRVSASDVSGYDIIDLNYSTNLAKSGVAVKVTSKPPTKSNSNS